MFVFLLLVSLELGVKLNHSSCITPKSTRNIKIPALPETAEIKPSVVMESIA